MGDVKNNFCVRNRKKSTVKINALQNTVFSRCTKIHVWKLVDTLYHFCKKSAVVFRKAILWACFDPVASKHVSQDILLRVQSQYEQIRTLDLEVNPVKKVGLIVCGHEGQLFIDDLVVDGEGGPAADDDTQDATVTDLNMKRRRQSSELQAVLSQLGVLRKQNEVLRTELDIMKTHISKKLKYMSDTMNRIAAIPATMSEKRYTNLTSTVTNPSDPTSPIVSTGTNGTRAKSKLCRNPKSLYMLWNEYEFVVGGGKPAKSFTKEERGADRFNYYKRNIFWSLVVEMV